MFAYFIISLFDVNKWLYDKYTQLAPSPFLDGGRYHIETNPLICGANQWTGFYMITTSVMKGLKLT